MKRRISLLLALMLTMSLTLSCAGEGLGEPDAVTYVVRVGTLTMLNMSGEEAAGLFAARRLINGQLAREGLQHTAFDGGDVDRNPILDEKIRIVYETVFYDSLDAMLMALNAGEIDIMSIYSTTAAYLCANNSQLMCSVVYQDVEETESAFARLVLSGALANDFAFMLMEKNEALRDELNGAISQIRSEGTLDQLVTVHIDAAIAGRDIAPVEMTASGGPDKIRVAVTGSLPPMDYISPDGSPAGFNTALLSEISRRIGRDIELVQVDSLGRAAALASGTVDAVFWTRTSALSNQLDAMTQEEKDAFISDPRSQFTDEEKEVVDQISRIIDFSGYGLKDMPEGTIITDAYFSDYFAPVVHRDSFAPSVAAP